MELIDAETLRRTASFEAFPGRAAVAIDYSADGRRLAVAGEGGGVGVWDVESGEQLGALLRAPRGPRGPGPTSTREPSRRSPSARAICSPRRRWGARCGSGTSAGASCFDRRCACLPPCSGWRSARTARSWRFRSVLSPTKVPTESRSSTSEAASGLPGFPRRRGRLGCLLPRRQPARGWRGRRRRAPLGDRRLAAGGTSARSPRTRPLSKWSSPRTGTHLRPHTRTDSAALWDVASQEPIGPRLPATTAEPGSDAAVTARFTPDGARLFVVPRLRRARDPLGGRSRALAATRVRPRRRRPHARAVGGVVPGAGLRLRLPLRLTADRLAPQTAPARQ